MTPSDISKISYSALAGQLSKNLRGNQRAIEDYLHRRGWRLDVGRPNAGDMSNLWRDDPAKTMDVKPWEAAFTTQRDRDDEAAKPLIAAILAEPKPAVLPN